MKTFATIEIMEILLKYEIVKGNVKICALIETTSSVATGRMYFRATNGKALERNLKILG
ncbi:hypothetical protein JGI16_11433 [Candidatus Kryptonium thompsonii]|nr:hypothetical protein JGI16_11433 [Candidatus Kryptonium thompsoni]